MGGDSLSITKGIVSRITMTRYVVASNKLLGTVSRKANTRAMVISMWV